MNIYDTLNPAQKEAVQYTQGPLLILAGAGSGKTRVLTHRIAYLIDNCSVNPWNILALTFTNKAAKEMRERVDNIVGYGSENIWVSTFHSTCVRILRRDIDKLGYDKSFTIYDTDDQKTLIKDICKKQNIDTKNYNERSFMSAISTAKDELVSSTEYALKAQGNFNMKRIASVYTEYQAALKNNNALDFDDLIVKTVELFKNYPEVLTYYQNRFKYIMVDEYQDTNTAQFKLISILASRDRNLCVVGDDDQSIYKFRGANIFNILNFEHEYPDAKVIKLEQNYLSTKNILNAANTVIRNNTGRKDKTLWTDNDDGDLINFLHLDSEYDEASVIVDEIDKMVLDGAEFNNFAILYRTNAQSRVFEEKFVLKSIPYKIVGGVNFYQRKEIKDLLSYLKTVNNGMDDLAIKRIINVPKRGIGATTISKIDSYASFNNISFYEAMSKAEDIQTLGKSTSKIISFVNFIRLLRTKVFSNSISLKELITEIIETTGYVKELELENTDESLSRIENINELINKIVTYENNAIENMQPPSLSEFLEDVALVADIDNLNESNNSVVLMTIHSAKGLEFPFVYISGMEDGIFPSYMTIKSGELEELEEERRLCYVGITRARERLTLTAAKRRMIRGETQINMLSRFIKEIPKNLLLGLNGNIKTQKNMSTLSFTDDKPVFNNQIPYQTKQFSTPTLSKLDYEVGDTVKHLKFGVGLVTDITSGGKDFEVTVSFNNVGVKKMFASFANLKKLS